MGLIDKIRKGMNIALVGAMGLGCVEAPKNGQFYTHEEIAEQEERAAFLRGTGLLFRLAGVDAEDPLEAARLGFISQASNMAASGQERLAAGKYQGQQANMTIVPKYIQIPRNQFFICNYFKGDLNNNGDIDPQELEGYGEKMFDLAENKRINIGFQIKYPFHFNKILNFKIYGPDNNQISIDNYFTGNGISVVLPILSKNPGRYFAEWKIQDETVGALDFEIVDNERKRNFKPYIPK